PSERPTRIGMLRIAGRPDTTALAAAHAAALQGAELLFFTPDDVNISDRSISALIYRGGAWIRTEASFPDVIDNDEKSRGATKVWKALSSGLPITTHQLGGKLEVMTRMKAADLYNRYQIPAAIITCLEDLTSFLAHYRRIVTKPVRGSQGSNVSFFSCEGDGYVASIRGRVLRLDRGGLREFYASSFRGQSYLAQKYIESRTSDGL